MSDLAYRTLLGALDGMVNGYYVTVDLIRDELDAAQLSSAEKSGAFRTACAEGYLRAVTMLIDGQVQAVTVRTRHEAGKGRFVRLYRRTPKAIPAHLCQAVS